MEQIIEIWMEGFEATGQWEQARFLASYSASDFDDAVQKYIKNYPVTKDSAGPYRYTRNDFTSEEAYLNRRADWHMWGCGLFNNEQDARKSFG